MTQERMYRGNIFNIYEELDYYIVVVNDETYMLNSYVDVNEFIMCYNSDIEEEEFNGIH